MPDVRGLLSDPEFNALPLERRRAILARINPDLANDYAATRVAAPETRPEPSLGERLGGLFNQGRALDMGLRVGSAKAAGRMAVGLGEMIRKAMGLQEQPLGSTAEALGLTPQGGVEQAGAMVTDAVPFMATGGATAGYSLPARVAAEGGLSALIAKAQGGDPTTAGVFGAAGPLIGATGEAIAPRLAAGARRGYAQFMGAARDANKAKAERVIPRLLDEGVSGSREAVLARATAGREAAGQAVGDVARAQGQTPIVTQRAADSLDNLKAEFLVKQANGTMAPATKAAEGQIKLIEDLQQRIRDTEPTLESVRALRRVLGKESKFNRMAPADDQTAAAIKKEAYAALKRELHKASPDLARVDKEFSFWRDVQDVMEATVKNKKPQEGSVVEKAVRRVSQGGALLGVGTANPALLTSSLLMGALNKVVSSPAYKSWSAIRKDRLARALLSGDHRIIYDMARGMASSETAR